MKKRVALMILFCAMGLGITACGTNKNLKHEISDADLSVEYSSNEIVKETDVSSLTASMIVETDSVETEIDVQEAPLSEEVFEWDESWQYAGNSKIHSGTVTLYRADENIAKHIVVAVNAGHGTSGGSSVKTLCHPDGSEKVTGGSTSSGSTQATAVAGGTTMSDGTPEAVVTLKLAQITKTTLLEAGYDVLMIRDGEDVQLDNIARTVFSNNLADCHIALHYDSTQNDKGAFYIGVPDIASYRSMEPVKSHWEQHNRLGKCLIDGMREQGRKIFGSENIPLDLTQTSYSTIPSVDLEVGDRESDYSQENLEKIANGIAIGLDSYYSK